MEMIVQCSLIYNESSYIGLKVWSSSQVFSLHWLQVGLTSSDLPFIAERDPQMQVMADLSSENANWHLSQLMVLEYGCALFTDRSVASRWYKSVPSLPMPPVTSLTACCVTCRRIVIVLKYGLIEKQMTAHLLEGYPLESCPPEPQSDLPPAYATHKQEPPPAYNSQA